VDQNQRQLFNNQLLGLDQWVQHQQQAVDYQPLEWEEDQDYQE
jgi:hypothetical protein